METGVQGGGESTEQSQDTGQEAQDSRLLQEFENFRTDVTSRLQQMQDSYEVEDDEGEEEEQAADEVGTGAPQFTDDDFDDNGNLSQEAQSRALRGVMQDVFAEMIQPHVEETRQIRNERMQEKNDAYADYLEATYPDLQDADTQNEVLEQAAVQAGYYAEAMGRPELAELANSPQFIEQIYLAEQAKKGKGVAGAAGQQDVQLETGGSAGPAPAALDDDAMGDKIVNAGRNRRFRLGSGGG